MIFFFSSHLILYPFQKTNKQISIFLKSKIWIPVFICTRSSLMWGSFMQRYVYLCIPQSSLLWDLLTSLRQSQRTINRRLVNLSVFQCPGISCYQCSLPQASIIFFLLSSIYFRLPLLWTIATNPPQCLFTAYTQYEVEAEYVLVSFFKWDMEEEKKNIM